MIKMEKWTVNRTNLKIISILAFLVGSSSISYAKTTYSEDDLNQFNETNVCIKCDLTDADLVGKENAVLDGSILIGSYIEGQMSGSSYINSVLTKTHSGYHNEFYSMVSNFEGAMMNHANFERAYLSGSNFENVNLTKANLSWANLSSSNFNNANVAGVNFNHSILIGSNLTQEQLKQAKSYFCAVLPDGTLVLPEHEWQNC